MCINARGQLTVKEGKPFSKKYLMVVRAWADVESLRVIIVMFGLIVCSVLVNHEWVS
jgi:hypothetical protein